jgi:Raf kinase inhibitor-like YbhB/YbcL family protein
MSKFKIFYLFSRILLLFLLIQLAACSSTGETEVDGAEIQEESEMTIQISSQAFEEGSAIPQLYGCDGDDVSPPLTWINLPENTVSTALIMDDPDAPAGTWVHWVLYDLPGDKTNLSEDMPKSSDLPGGGKQGSNSWGRTGYGGPCPPGGAHRYFFKLYALDTFLSLKAGASKEELLQAMEGHILEQGQLMGIYSRT